MPENVQGKVDEIMQGQTNNNLSDLEKLKAENDAYEREIKRAEELRQKKLLGGKSEVVHVPEKTKQQEVDEQAKALIQRHGFR